MTAKLKGSDLKDTIKGALKEVRLPAAGRSKGTAKPDMEAEKPQEPKLSRKRLATRAKLIDAAGQLFATQGVSATSLEEICEAAGFTRGALYSNFTDKNDLLMHVIEAEYARLFAYLDDHWQEILKEARPENYQEIVSNLLHSLPVDRNYILLQQQVAMSALRSPELGRMTAPLSDRFAAKVGKFVADSLNSIGRVPVIAEAQIGEFVIALVERTLKRHEMVNPGEDFSEEKLAELIKVWLPNLLESLSKPAATSEK
ncbi:hypothetical protein BSR29_06940 [Boudabousia liubingyangii]|uniref:HTH tetR-type domain-containing protein n=1 Tax=Boudabousia liubingyangii TaxID=1921764 RepID=A0A1Q5PK13_9ACTO|nr:TetR/AcrR family transcriptional regulator [Boudabousia liubingyangii]OKL46559.1 hypothetical protein BSR29_06940 [Boudabousia liubingyangii]OKL46856.1 hypothetical protein BSR28_05350 [Boudabousia liubingyangii]